MNKADWLRSEIEKLEVEKKPIRHFAEHDDGRSVELDPRGRHKCNSNCKPDTDEIGYNQALTSIITRYKEELKVLESKYETNTQTTCKSTEGEA